MNMVFFRAAFFFVLLPALAGCVKKASPAEVEALCQYQLTEANQVLTEVIMNDVFTPPVASRIYAYANVAAYEAMQSGHPSFTSLAEQLNGLSAMPAPDPNKIYAFPVASQVAFIEVASQLVFTEEKLGEYLKGYLKKMEKSGVDKEVLRASVTYGKEVAQHISAWMHADGYRKTRGQRHTVSSTPGKWRPTAPDFMEAIEPHWAHIRPFVLDSANQFFPKQTPSFDTIPGSAFYQETMEVYQAVKNMNAEQEAIARYWDCNPNIAFVRGHVKYYKQQLSPGGHWISIACIAAANEKFSALEHAQVLSLVSIALADGFISCWNTKFTTDVIRPETYIERYIDKSWRPLLQTPAFPEYTSGHSVISSSAATALSHVFGSQYAFTDTSQVSFGLPSRHFSSFVAAAEEAALSRLYGGIHYRPAIEHGKEQGKQVGNLVAGKLSFRKEGPLARK
ncbi:hypothetical protein BH24BAC1_BH24BAC1_37230 [soil metagenome]